MLKLARRSFIIYSRTVLPFRCAVHVIWREVVRVDAGPFWLELPVWGSINWIAALLLAKALVAVFRLKLGMATVLGGAAVLGLLLHLVGLA